MDTAVLHSIAEKFARLAPEQRRTAYQKLQAEGFALGQFPILPRLNPDESETASYAQQRMHFLWQLEPASSAYHISGALRLAGDVRPDVIDSVFGELVARHEALRTVFVSAEDGTILQRVLPASDFAVAIHDVRALDEASRPAATQTFADALQHTPFDLAAGPLLRVGLIQESDSQAVLVVVMHHIISDGWSMAVIVKEFVALYQAAVSGVAANLVPLPIQYADYAQWQRHWLEAGERDRQLAYWREQLGNEHPVLQLPADHARRADGQYRAAQHAVSVPADLAQALQQRARENGSTLFMLLLTAFQALLHRYSGLADIRVGVPIANRHRVETESVVGFFVNTQVLRADISGRQTLASLLTQVRERALGAQAHQDLPFEQLVEALQPERTLGVSPLFQLMFNHLREAGGQLAQLPGLTISDYALGEQAAQFELTLNSVELDNGGLALSFDYARELFNADTVARWAGHYLAMLDALAHAPQTAIADVALLSAAEQQCLRDWGVNETTYPDVKAVHELFEAQAAANPHAIALIFGETELTYRELDTRANRLAHQLLAQGIPREARIGIALERSIEMVVGLLAILKAGAAYVPLDPDYPADRLAHMVEDAGLSLLLTHSALVDKLPAAGVPVVRVDVIPDTDYPASKPAISVHPEQLAYVIYTSGSTGKPKGVAVAHGPISMHCRATAPLYDMSPATRELHFLSFAFDGAHERLLTIFHAGGAVLLRDNTLWSPTQTLAAMQKWQATHGGFPPAYLREMIESAKHTPFEHTLQLCSFGGEAMPGESLTAIRVHLHAQTLINGYGPTETVVTPMLWRSDEDSHCRSAYAPIGRPVGERVAYVLDADLALVPPGVAGELYLGGYSLARGYLNRAGLSAERFIADPFDASGGRLYRTGDLVRWNSEGQLEYLGRIDHQVKIRGFRIELGEIEAQLLAQEAVREAVVIARHDAGNARLVAYVSLKAGCDVDAANLKAAIATSLPDYMLPSAIVLLDALPLNPNGKVDRKALPAPEFASVGEYVAPEGEVEQKLATIWAEVLGVAQVGRHDSFFELGGHSLLALTLLERMRRDGFSVSVKTLFQQPVLADFARAIAGETDEAVIVPPNGIPAACSRITPEMLPLVALSQADIDAIAAKVPGGMANIQDIYPLAPLQEGILFHHRLQAVGDAYITTSLMAFDDRARLETFISDLNAVIARHDILRTAVLWQDLPEPVQVVWRKTALAIEWLAAPADEPDLAHWLTAQVDPAEHRLDVRHAPMLRAVAVDDVANGRVLLQLPSHHLILDHTTLELIVAEIGLIRAGRVTELPTPVPFRNFVAQARLGVSQAEHEAYFRSLLGDVDEPTAPFGLTDIQGSGADVREVRQRLDDELALAIRQQARRHGVSAAALCHLAWAMVLARTSGRDDVVFGTVLFGRMQGGEGADRALGLFINTLPLRVKLASQNVLAALKATQDGLAGLLRHEHASLALAQRCSGLPGGTPLFTSMLNYRYSPEGATDDQHWTGLTMLGAEERTNYPIGLSVDDLGEGFILAAQSVASIATERLCDYMTLALTGLTEALAQAPATPLTQLNLLPAAEHALLHSWGVNETTYPDVKAVHELFEAQAAANPHAIALIFGETELTYRELDTRANRLAHQLLAQGIPREARIGIALERSIEMVVGLLAILKAGAAYVPLDPDYPADRLAHMVEDAGLSLLLTHSALVDKLPAAGVPVVRVDVIPDTDYPASKPAISVHPEQLAYVIYTSGSTGKPKGVAVAQRAFAEHVLISADFSSLTSSDRMLQFSTLNFDGFIEQMFPPFTVGAAVVLRGPDVWSAERFHHELLDKQITIADLPTAYWFAIAQAFASAGHTSYGRLREMHMGGEAMPPEGVQAWQRAGLQQVKLLNTYGPTECIVVSTTLDCQSYLDGEQAIPAIMPIGQPLPGRRLYVLDQNLNPVPAGVAGELYIGGQLHARGYLNRPAQSAQTFIADPFDASGGRLYRTGDLVRWNSEGQLEYLGRIDHQVKIRGFRIELGEIEAQLLAQEAVREAVVIARHDAGNARLVAYVSLKAGCDVDAANLKAAIATSLPDYMLPSAIVLLDALPLNPNGKVDRKALPAPEFASVGEYVAPEGEVEQKLATIWAEVLGVAQVGRHDSFFELGGHSLLALTLLERMRRDGFSVSVKTLFQQPVLADFARAIAGETDEAVIVPPNGIPAACSRITPEMLPLVALSQADIDAIAAKVPGGMANIQDIYPLAPLQEGILFHHRLQAVGDAYITTSLMAFDDRARLETFISDLNAVIARHDILRTAVLWQDLPEPVQVVWRKTALAIEWLAAPADEPDLAHWLTAQVDPAEHRLDVRHAPMLRAVAVDDVANGRVLLQLPSHHLILDHTTLELIVAEIGLIRAGRVTELPTPVPFRNFVAQARLGVSQAEHEAYFRSLLGDVDEPTAPFGLTDIQGSGADVREVRQRLDDELALAIRQQARRHGVSAAALCHLAWAMVLARTSGRDDVVFGTVLFGRMQGGEGADRALGLFINTLPLRVKLASQNVLAALKATQDGLAGLLRHEHASLALAQRCSGLPGGTPLFTSMLNYRYSPEGATDDQHWTGLTMLGAEERTNYPIGLSVDDLGEGFILAAQSVASIATERLCDYMTLALTGLTEALAQAPATPLTQLNLLPAAEHALLHSWGVNETTYPDVKAVHELFEAQAAANPHAIALIFGETELTYRELDTRANRLAHQLLAQGIPREARIGIALERSIEMVVGLLAILKAGAAYVPLDPDYPADRLAHMVEDAGLSLLLTHSALVDKLPAAGVPVVRVDVIPDTDYPASKPAISVHPEQLAYVIYTSGSTGKPKGVAVAQRAFAEHVLISADFSSLTSSDRMLQFSTLNFDGFIEQMFPPFTVGAAVVLRGPDVWSAERFHHELLDKQITIADLPTAYWFAIAQAFASAGHTSYGRLREMHMGGEAMPPEGVQAWQRAGLQQVKLLNTYGPTECIVVSTTLDCQSYLDGEQAIPAIMPIGQPLPGRRLYVLDQNLNPVPAGVAGELYIGGQLHARGYLNRPAQSAQTFIADPFDASGGRLYRTGDLVRWNSEGQLEYLGRIDHQVKIRGFRIELGEIEAQLLAQEAVREAVVIARHDAGNARLVAYVSLKAGCDVDAANLKAAIATSLPDYMLPSAIVLLDALPLNPNGKVDRKALPAPEFASVGEYVAPVGEVEEKLATIWAEVLGVAQVGRHDSFFELGGHSLLVLQLQMKIEKTFGLQLAIREAFQAIHLHEQASLLATLNQTDTTEELDSMTALLDMLED